MPMTNEPKSSLWQMLRHPLVILTIIICLLIALITRFYQLDVAPAGGDGDVAWLAIEAVDWVDRGAYPYYVDAAHFPAPLVIALISLSIMLHGVAIETPRLVTAFGSVFIALAMIPIAWTLLADDKSERRRLLVGLCAMAAAATSLHAMNVARLGVNTTMLPIFITLAIWATAAAWQHGGLWRWMLAGLCLALTQYVYISAHFMGVVAIAWFLHAALATRQQFKQRWRGWFIMAATTLVVYAPNLILYARWPEAFTQRLDSTGMGTVEKLIWTHDFSDSGGMLSFIISKLYQTAVRIGFPWETGYLPLSTPLLMPLFFIAWLIGIGLCLWRFRRSAYGWVLLALPILAMADVLTSIALQPNPMRQIALTPFHYLVAGFGLAEVLLLLIRYSPQLPRAALFAALAALAIIPTATGFYQYIAVEVPSHYANPETAWRISQTDLDITERIAADPTQSYLLPYGEYTRKNIAWLSFASFRERGSILAADGSLLPPTLPENIVVIQATNPSRARHTQTVGLTRPAWWVLYHDGHIYFMPPLDPAQQDDLFAALQTTEPEQLIDASNTHIADLYPIETPQSLFITPPYTPLDATFALAGAQPEAQLLGYTTSPAQPIPGAEFEVSLYWQTLRPMPRNYEIVVQLWDDSGTSYGNSHSLPFDSTYRTRIWREDEITVTHHVLFLSEQMPVGRYHLVAALQRHLANENLTVTGADASGNNEWAMASDFRILPEGGSDDTPLANEINPIDFGSLLTLHSLEILSAETTLLPFADWSLNAGDALNFALQWRVDVPPSLDYSLFIHVTPADDAAPLAQADLPLDSAGLPSSVWQSGEFWTTTPQLALPDDLPAGRYDVWLGVYFYGDGTRLPVAGAGQSGDRAKLGQIVIE